MHKIAALLSGGTDPFKRNARRVNVLDVQSPTGRGRTATASKSPEIRLDCIIFSAHAVIMSTMKTIALLAGSLCVVPLGAKSEGDHLDLFASCTGRLSAQVEHLWLLKDPAAAEAEHTRDMLADLMESVAQNPDDEVQAMALRLNAKVAHAQLLTRATFSANSESAAWANRRAQALIGGCVALVLIGPERNTVDRQDSIPTRTSLN